jgi:hypothetical protein
VLFAGLAATLAVIAVSMAGLLDGFEWWSQDQRFLRARRIPEPLSKGVALVAIDDRALDTIGRWPWSRDVLALAFDEIAIAGARTVASDVLFTDVQSVAADTALAAGIARSPTVLAVNMDEGRLDATLWLSAEGRQALNSLVAVIAADNLSSGMQPYLGAGYAIGREATVDQPGWRMHADVGLVSPGTSQADRIGPLFKLNLRYGF